jgi:hypothetical protein
MPNQPVHFARRNRPSAASPIALALVVLIAGGVLVGTVAMLAVGIGLFDGPAAASPSVGTARPGASQPAASGIAQHSAAPGSPSVSQPAGSPGIGSLDPPPKAGPFSIDLYRKGAFVSELKPINCVPAAMQTMINMMSSGPVDRTRETQQSLYRLARKLSGSGLVGDGAEPEGWAAGLTQLGFGDWQVAVEPTRKAAVARAVTALRMTGRPVGLLTWKGAHSWVMSGFEATADPAFTSAFTVTGLFVEDVWYPAVSSIWGPSLPPDSLDPFADLHIDYLPWHRPTHKYPDKDGQFVMVLPVLSAGHRVVGG